MCPYYRIQNERCNIYDTYQDSQYHRENYCMSSENYKNCANITNSSQQTLYDKVVR
jgi:hypothetical protein